MTDKSIANTSAAERAARMQLQAEHRAIVQASLAAKRSGRLGYGHKPSSGSEAITALVVAAVVIGLLVLVLRFAG